MGRDRVNVKNAISISTRHKAEFLISVVGLMLEFLVVQLYLNFLLVDLHSTHQVAGYG